jgi:hypothetical protein
VTQIVSCELCKQEVFKTVGPGGCFKMKRKSGKMFLNVLVILFVMYQASGNRKGTFVCHAMFRPNVSSNFPDL